MRDIQIPGVWSLSLRFSAMLNIYNNFKNHNTPMLVIGFILISIKHPTKKFVFGEMNKTWLFSNFFNCFYFDNNVVFICHINDGNASLSKCAFAK